jgi:glycosidase
VQSKASKDSPLRNWYLWRDEKPEGWNIRGSNPWRPAAGGYFFATFGPQMPDFNLRNPAVLAYHRDNLRFWLNRGVDGFRFDAVTHLIENDAGQLEDQPDSHALMHQLQQLVASYPQRHVVCEAATSWPRWASPQSCGSAFALDLPALEIAASRGDAAAVQRLARYFSSQPSTLATMLSNQEASAGKRLWDQLKGDTAAYRMAAASYLLLPGTPFIYYGEEVGMAGVARLEGDAQLRTPMSWSADGRGFSSGTPFRPLSDNAASNNVAAALADPQSLLAFYKSLLALRNNLPALARGSYLAPQVEGQVMAFQRQLGNERVLVLINYGRDAATLRVTGLPPNAALSNEYPAGGALSQADAGGAIRFGLAGQSLRVLRLMAMR